MLSLQRIKTVAIVAAFVLSNCFTGYKAYHYHTLQDDAAYKKQNQLLINEFNSSQAKNEALNQENNKLLLKNNVLNQKLMDKYKNETTKNVIYINCVLPLTGVWSVNTAVATSNQIISP